MARHVAAEQTSLVCTLVNDATRRFGRYFDRVAINSPVGKVNSPCGGEMRLRRLLCRLVERFHFVTDGYPSPRMIRGKVPPILIPPPPTAIACPSDV